MHKFKPMSTVIRTATEADFPIIQHIAHATWPVTFADILSPRQIDYMLEWMYSLPALAEQVAGRGHIFLLAELDGQAVGYLSYEQHYQGSAATKIHKIYIRPSAQGQGIGRALIDAATDRARAAGDRVLLLNVNRNNRAVQFYEYLGFTVIDREDIDIGEGFLMEDFVMELKVQPL